MTCKQESSYKPTCRESAHVGQTLDPVLHFTLAATLKVVVPGLVAEEVYGELEDVGPVLHGQRGHHVFAVAQVDGFPVVLGTLLFRGVVLHQSARPQHKIPTLPLL